MKVLCKISEREFLRLRGEHFPTTKLEEEHFAILFLKDRLHLQSAEKHRWAFRFPEMLRGPKREIFVEEHPFLGASRRPDRLLVKKSICGINGRQIPPVIGRPDIYLSPSLATVSRYDNAERTVTIKELEVFQACPERWWLVISVWRGGSDLAMRNSRLAGYRPVIQAAEIHLLAFQRKRREQRDRRIPILRVA